MIGNRTIQETTLLRDGTPVLIRQTVPTDLILIDKMHGRLSPITRYLRYLRPYNPTLTDAHRISHIEEEVGMGLVAIVEQPQTAVIGVAHYVMESRQLPRTAEPAFLVEDQFQGLGLGQALFRGLSTSAMARDVDKFHTFVHILNKRMMNTLQKSGYPLQSRRMVDVYEVQILLR